eukprot:scaffold69897_cov21-Prasinocladus_malaysianus.AAC.2
MVPVYWSKMLQPNRKPKPVAVYSSANYSGAQDRADFMKARLTQIQCTNTYGKASKRPFHPLPHGWSK